MKYFTLYLSVILLAVACKDKDKKPTPQPVDISAEFEILVPSSGFKTLWTFQPSYVTPTFTDDILIKNYTLNTQTNKLYMLVSVLNKTKILPWSVQRVTANLTDNTELISEDYEIDKGIGYKMGYRNASCFYQPFQNNLFSWNHDGTSGEIYKNAVLEKYASEMAGWGWRISREGLILKQAIASNKQRIYTDKTFVLKKLGEEKEFEYGITEPVNDTTDYYFVFCRNTKNLGAVFLDELRLYKSSMRNNAQTNYMDFGQSKLLSYINLGIDLLNKEIDYKIHYTNDPNLLVLGMIVKDPNQLGTKFYSFIWNIETENIIKVLDGIEASTSAIANKVIFDLDDNGNVYYAHTSDINMPPNAIFKATASGISQLGKIDFFRKDIPDGSTTIRDIKVFNNKPYIALLYRNAFGQYANKENNISSQICIVVPE